MLLKTMFIDKRGRPVFEPLETIADDSSLSQGLWFVSQSELGMEMEETIITRGKFPCVECPFLL